MTAFNQAREVTIETQFRAKHLTHTARESAAFYDSYQSLSREYVLLFNAFKAVMDDFEILNKSQELLSFSLNSNLAKIQILVGMAMESQDVAAALTDELASLATIVNNLHVFLNDESQFAAIADQVDGPIFEGAVRLSKHRKLLLPGGDK